MLTGKKHIFLVSSECFFLKRQHVSKVLQKLDILKMVTFNHQLNMFLLPFVEKLFCSLETLNKHQTPDTTELFKQKSIFVKVWPENFLF